MSEPKATGGHGHSARAGRILAPKSALLVIEEACVRDLIAVHLRSIGWFPVAAPTWQEGLRIAGQVLPDVVVVDLDTPATSRADWLDELRRPGSEGRAVRTVVLSSQVEQDRAAGRVPGTVDLWVDKPFNAGTLTTRLVRLLRPARTESSATRPKAALRFPGLELDRHQPTIRVQRMGNWQTRNLPRTEHRLLEILLADPARVHSREAICDSIWPGAAVDQRTVDQYIRRLRRTLASVDAGDLICTVIGAGYRLRTEVLDRSADPVG